MSNIKLEPEQEEAAGRMILAAEDGEDFAVDGLAGTGKTTVLGVVAGELKRAKLVAPTGKAASVLAKKTGMPATTIHRAIYHPPTEIVDPATGKRRLVWERRREPGSLRGTTFLVDEASMVNTVLAREMVDTGANLVAVFDSGQLPPVEGTPFFTEADFTLRQVHRQALESPIIRQAHAVRRGGLLSARRRCLPCRWHDRCPRRRRDRVAEEQHPRLRQPAVPHARRAHLAAACQR
jgi:exodeoxyribonuclease V